MAMIQATLVMVAVKNGLGRKADGLVTGQESLVMKMIYASTLLYIAALALGKLAVILLLFRLSGSALQRIASGAAAGALGVWVTASVIAIGIRPDTDKPWEVHSYFSPSTVSQ